MLEARPDWDRLSDDDLGNWAICPDLAPILLIEMTELATVTYSLAELNQMDQAQFTDVLGAVFEDTPAIAHRTWSARPFHTLADLHRSMVAVVAAMSVAEQLTLIRAHPDLGSKAQMAAASVQEQAGAGLNQLNSEEYETFHRLNREYKEKFGFPFIIAVKHHTKDSILTAFEQRLHHGAEQERQQALSEIAQIAQFRLQDLIKADS